MCWCRHQIYQDKSGTMEEKKTWWQRSGWIAVGGGVLILFIVTSFTGGQHSSTTASGAQATNGSSDLNTQLLPNTSGISIINKEGTDWTDCMVGFNGSTGWGFDNPPYQTRTLFTVPAGQTVQVSYQKITAQDGTIFDLTTHAINTIVLDCFRGTTSERSWVGTAR